MNKKIRKKIKAEIIKNCFSPSNGKPLGIFRDMLENAKCLVEDVADNPKITFSTFHVKIVNPNKLLKRGYRWVDSKGMLKNNDLFKVGDVGYINLEHDEGYYITPIASKLYGECIGVKILGEIPLEINLVYRNSS